MLRRRARRLARLALDLALYPMIRVRPRSVVFSNFGGGGFGCNPKYLTEEILRRDLGWDVVWLVGPTVDRTGFPPGVRLVDANSLRALCELRAARAWVVNTLAEPWSTRKSPGQFYLQTGHGSFGIKRIGLDAHDTSPRRRRMISRQAVKLDLFTSHSAFETRVHADGFGYGGRIRELGHARNDPFFGPRESIADDVRSALGVGAEQRIALHVPSFRADGAADALELDYPALQGALSRRFGGDWVSVVRYHPRSRAAGMTAPPGVIDASAYPDIQELLVAADVAVSDYSSCLFDFLLTGRPGFVHAPDAEDFAVRQGLYFPLSEAPFPVALSAGELVAAIEGFDADGYADRIAAFLDRQGSVEDGQASRRIVDLLEGVVGEGGDG